MDIFYFSGTGFTLDAAHRLAESLDEEVNLRPIVGLMREGVVSTDAEVVGLAVPMNAFGLPLVVRQFLKEFRFPKARYIFALVTRGGAPTRMHREIIRLLKRQGKELNAFQYSTNANTFETIIPMHKGDSTFLETPPQAIIDIAQFADQVNRRENRINLGYRRWFKEWILFPLMQAMGRATRFYGLEKDFYTDDQCAGCGQCEQTCLSGKIRMVDGKPVWQEEVACFQCLACLHLCSQRSIQVKKTKSPELGRIHHIEVKWSEIAQQKSTH